MAITEATVATNGVELHVLEAGAANPGPLVVLAHGFPELGFSWRHQLPALAAAGCHAVAPDQRGYGASSKPAAVEDYGILRLVGDLLGLLDSYGAERAVVVGHDWGSMVASAFAGLHPDRVAALVNMSVPHLPRGPVPPLRLLRRAAGDSFFYILYFQAPGVAEADLEADTARTMRRLLCGAALRGGASAAGFAADDGRGFVDRLAEPEGLPEWLSQAELDVYVETFARTGFTGGLNWYRNMDRNWAETEALAGAKVAAPSLFIAGALDPVLAMTPPGVGSAALEDHRGDLLIEGAGHWVQQEKPAEVNAALVSFIAELS